MTLLVAFYQDNDQSNGQYAEHAKRLRAECKAAGQKHSVVKRTYGDDYLSITRAKPQFMLEQLDKHDEDLIYVDVDITLLKAFDDLEFDRIGWAVKPSGLPYGHVHYLPNNDATRAFLNAWAETVDGWEGGDHSAMWVTLNNTGYDWAPITNIDGYVTIGLADNPGAKAAHARLKADGWIKTVKARLGR